MAVLSLQMVVGLVAKDLVIATATDGILNERARIPLVLEGIVDVPVDARTIVFLRQLRTGEPGEATRAQIDQSIIAELRHVISVDAATIPDRQEDQSTESAALTDGVAVALFDEHCA